MPSCRQIIEELENYLEGDLDREELLELKNHLSRCRSCRALYDSTRKTLTILTDAGSLELPEKVSRRVVSGIMSRIRRMRK